MPRPKRSPEPPAPPPGRLREGNVVPIEGWVEPMRCPECEGSRILQIDLVECAHRVTGVRKPWGIVVVDMAHGRVDRRAVRSELFRCRECGHEWPVAEGTAFMSPTSG